MKEHVPTHRERILEALSAGRLMHHRDLAGMGVSRMAMSRLVRDGAVVRDGEGYRAPCAPWATTVQQVALRWPDAVFCLLTAQAMHGLTEAAETFTVAALPRNADRHASRRPDIPNLELITWSTPSFYTLGVERADIGGGRTALRTDIFRTVADMWRPEHVQDPEQAAKAAAIVARDHGRAGLNRVHAHAVRLGFGKHVPFTAALAAFAEVPRAP